jgi:hypothetical protein
LKTSEVRFILKDKNLDSSGNKSVIKERLDQHSSYDLLYNSMLLDDNDIDDINMRDLLKPGFALKSKQIFGKKGGGKRINLEVVEKLKEMFLAGNIEKNQKLSAENMLRNLQLYAENNEIEFNNIPSLQQIKSWITRFNQYHKRQAAENNV